MVSPAKTKQSQLKQHLSLLFEPKRPNNYRGLPQFKDSLYWSRMARAVTLLKPHILEVSRYGDRRLRAMGLIVGVFLLIVIPASFIRSEGSLSNWRASMANSYDYVFNFEEGTRKQYYKEPFLQEKYATPEDFIKVQLSGDLHSHRFIGEFGPYIFFGLMILGPFALMLFTPRRCPIRFDRKRELAYTWEKGELYIADIGPLLGGLNTHIESSMPDSPYTFFGADKSTGPMVIALHNISDKKDAPKEKNIGIGPYPVTHSHQNIDLTQLIAAFMSRYSYNEHSLRQEWSGDWLQQLQAKGHYLRDFLRRQSQWTLGRKYTFDEEKTEQLLMEYLTNPKTRDRGVPIRG